MFDATRLSLLAFSHSLPRSISLEQFPPLLCSQDIVLSILCSDILYTCAMRQALVEPYQAPREDNENTWGDDAKSIDPERRCSDRGEHVEP